MSASSEKQKGRYVSQYSVFVIEDTLTLISQCPAPRSIARRLVISETAAVPTPLDNQTKEPYRNPSRPPYPKELLQHAFKSYDSNTDQSITSAYSQYATYMVLWYQICAWKQPTHVPTLNAPEESLAADSDSATNIFADATEKDLWAGSRLGVVSGFQALSSARVTWVGRADLFSDKFTSKEISKGVKSGNIQFARVMSHLGLSKSPWCCASKMLTMISRIL